MRRRARQSRRGAVGGRSLGCG
uniref:Uncharacterized protein n=1 Tax=Arundo donax TaxID=35708 RepID=A0A0A9F085_ARUDO